MAKATKKDAPAKRAPDSEKRGNPGSKSNDLIDINLPGAETKKIPLKKQRT